MKKIFTLGFLCFVFCTFSFAQTVQQTQKALVGKKTATWCNPCGTWGWSLMNDLYAANSSKAVLFEFHNSSSSQLYSASALALYNHFESIGSTPAFYVGTTNQTQYAPSGGIYPVPTKNRINTMVDSLWNLSPVVNSGFNFTIQGNTITIDTKTKFFQNATGEFYLGVYIAEKNVVKYQNGIGNNAVHKNIYRAAATSQVMGDLIINGNASAGAEFTNQYNYTLNSTWDPANINVFTVIWKKNGSSYVYVNAFSEMNLTSVSSTKEEFANIQLLPSVTTSSQPAKLLISGSKLSENATIEMYDQIGKKVQSIYDGKLKEENEFELNTMLNAGIYFISIRTNDNIYSRRLIITD